MKSNCIKYMAIAFLLVLPFSACTPDDELSKEESAFAGKTVYGIYKADGNSITYAESTYQSAVSTSENSVRIQKDDMSQFFHIKIDGEISKGNKLQTQITSKGMQITAVSAEMSVLKTDSGKAWLWDAKDKVGYLVPLIK